MACPFREFLLGFVKNSVGLKERRKERWILCGNVCSFASVNTKKKYKEIGSHKNKEKGLEFREISCQFWIEMD